MREQTTKPALWIAIVGLTLAIFVADIYAALGIAVWVLYFCPIALSKFAWRPALPVLVATASSVLLVVGYVASPDQEMSSLAASYSTINRTFGLITMWIAALIGRTFITTRLAAARETWLRAASAALAARMLGEQSYDQLGDNILSFLAKQVGARVGAIYIVDAGVYRLRGTYAVARDACPAQAQSGEGLCGQAIRDRAMLHMKNAPAKYLDVSSSLGHHQPTQLLIAPCIDSDQVYAVIELGFLDHAREVDTELFDRVSSAIAVAVRTVAFRTRQAELLEETQRQAEELQAQQEELRVQNEELEQQSRTLQESQAQLENQQSELEQINSQLEEQTQALEGQRDDLMRAQRELQRANTYKSEFLANMSHELRTPLNSSLILAKLLFDNRPGNLNPEQVKFAQTIYSAGNDLLTLINDILDLSKIEAGKLDIRAEKVSIRRVIDALLATFKPLADDKKLELKLQVADDVTTIYTDVTRLQQVLKNLLSNAIKFTSVGSVSLDVQRVAGGGVTFAVRDTGIGIPAEQQGVIFEAFRQADGTTNRKYGGTGLGLSISRDLTRLLGGELTVDSASGRGSCFTLRLPERYTGPEQALIAEPSPPPTRSATTTLGHHPASNGQRAPRPTSAPSNGSATAVDDRERIRKDARTLLIIEDDAAFAQILLDLAHELSFQALIADTADEGLALAAQYRPHGIVLDLQLPDRSGLVVLDSLKRDAALRHVPVHIVSASDYSRTAMEMGAIGYAIKPVKREQLVEALQRLEAKVTQKLRRVLVVEDDEVHRDSTCQLLASDGVEAVAVGTAAAALEQLGASTFDCMVLDLRLPDRTGFDLLEDMSAQDAIGFPPVIVYTGRELSREEEQGLRRVSHSIIVKGARSPERLLDEVTLFLHQVESELPPDRQRMLRDARRRESSFDGKRVLIVEDDVRNIFALSSVLEPKGASVEIARNGIEALNHLRDRPGVDLVLMDVMMPEMDGLQAMHEIRKQPTLAKLPIIALTAKAMSDDRDNCLAAGANDYIAKPIDVERLLSLVRVWMPK